MPRKTLFKPIVRPKMLKNPLWCEVFLDKQENEGDESEVDVDEEDNGFSSNDELLMQHRRLISGLKSA
jgi:hypothetical protein